MAVPPERLTSSPWTVPPLRLREPVVTVAAVVPSYTLLSALNDPVSGRLFTVWVSALLVLPVKPEVAGLYVAVTEWLPTESVPAARPGVVQVAWLPLTAAAVQMVVAPSLKVTVPAPEIAGVEVTVAVKVTASPYVLVLPLLLRVVAVVVLDAVA